MPAIGLPDLLTAGRLSQGLGAVNLDLARVAEELSSGLRTDLVEAAGGDPTRLYVIERDLALNDTYQTTIDVATSRAEVTQSALSRVQDASATVGVPLLTAVERNDLDAAELIGREARSAFDSAIAALNARVGDRTLFSGAATTSQAMAAASDMLADIALRTAGATDAASLVAAVDEYFDDPAGFAATGYLGSIIDAPAAEISEGERLSFAVRGDNEAIVATLSALAVSVAASESTLGADARKAAFREAGQRGIEATASVISLRSDLGLAEARLEEASVAVEAARLFLEQGRSSLRARDPFEAATEFSALETQLQTMFSVTARLSSLSLNNFLR